MATKLDLADAQFIGFYHGRHESWIVRMVEAMGLTEKEWIKWKQEYNTSYMTEDEMHDIDEYFEREKVKR